MSYYETNKERLAFLGHCSYGVKDMTISEPFYTAAFKAFGIEVVYQDNKNITKAKVVGYGVGEAEWVCLFERKEAGAHGKGTHLAFNAPSRQAVHDFHEAAVKNGGKCDGPPGPRHEVGPLYYCCFVYDPDGYRFEAVFQQPVEE